MKKRTVSILLVILMCLTMLPTVSLADGTGTKQKLDDETYKQLGFASGMTNAQTEGAAMGAPYSEVHTTQMFTAREIYVAGNGADANRFTVRNGFDRMDANGEHKLDKNERFRGAYEYYGLQHKDQISKENGYSVDSNLSSNQKNSLNTGDNGFAGLYATSVAFNGGDGKDNYIAELRAYARNQVTRIGDKDYLGGISIEIFKLDAKGSRTYVQTLSPVLTPEMGWTNPHTGSSVMRYMTRHYVQELDATFEIQAADMDGDGVDELYAYSGRYGGKGEKGDNTYKRLAYIDVFEPSGGSYRRTGEIAVDAGRDGPDYFNFISSDNWERQIYAIPVVAMSVGDLNRDHREEVAVSVSCPNAQMDQKSSMAAHTAVFGKTGSSVRQLLDIPLNNGVAYLDGKRGYRGAFSAASTFGTFEIPGTSIAATVLITAGHASANYSNSTFPMSEIAYRYVWFDPAINQYQLSEYLTYDPADNSNLVKIKNSFKSKEIPEHDGISAFSNPVYAPTAMACADLEGQVKEGGNNNDELFLDGDIYRFDLRTGIVNAIGSVALTDQQRNNNGNSNKEKGQIWISSVEPGIVDTNPEDHGWRESFVYTSGAHRLEPVNGDYDYYWMDVGAAWMDGTPGNGVLCSEQEGAIVESNSRNDDYGTFLSICLPDLDDDTVYLKFKDKATLFTEPEIFAVLQASPYFADLENVEGYLNNGGTSFSTSKGQGTTTSTSLSQTLGVYASTSVDLFVSIDFQQTISATASYEFCNSQELEYAISYNSAAGNSDHVVVYTIPYEYYVYESYDPRTGDRGDVVIPVALTPVQTTMTVEKYDEIAGVTEGLEPVRNNILFNVPGCPETYDGNQLGGTNEFRFEDYSSAASSGSGSDVTQTISKTTQQEHSIALSTTISVEAGGGVGLLGNSIDVGIISDTEAGFGVTISSTKGTEFSGTVDNLPEGADNFMFNWQLRVNRAPITKDGKDKVWVVGYDVVSVVQPPRMPQNLRITEVAKHSIDLAWDHNGGTAAYYDLYQVNELGDLVKENDTPIPYAQTTYHVDRLISNREYTFCIEAVDAKGERSIMSPQVSATTLSSDVIITILKQPQDWKGEKNQKAVFETDAKLVMDEQDVPLLYQWQIKKNGAKLWEDLKEGGVYTGVKTKKLQVLTADTMNGDQLRCKIYVHNRPIIGYTDAAMVTVGDLNNYAVHFNGTVLHGLAFNDDVGTVTAACGDQTLTSGGSVKELSEVTVTATVQPGYGITGWFRGQFPIAEELIAHQTDGSQSFTIASVEQAEEITVQYVKYPVLTWTNPNHGGLAAKGTALGHAEESTLNSPETLAYGSKVTMTAEPDENYVVDHWTVNDVVQQQKGDVLILKEVKQDTAVTVTFMEGVSHTAAFTGTLEGGTFSDQVAELTMETDGALTTGKVYDEHSLTFKAVPKEGYLITSWKLNGREVQAEVHADKSQTVTIERMGEDAAAEVICKALTAKTYVTAGEHGTLESVKAASLDLTKKAQTGMEIKENVPVTITVKPDVGYEVQTWIVNRLAVPNHFENTYSYAADAFGAEIEVRFQPAAYLVRWENAAAEGKMSGESCRGGTQLTLTANDVRGKQLTGWTVNGEVLAGESEKNLTWTVPLGTPNDTVFEIKPVYETLKYQITVQQPAEGSITGENLVENVAALDAGSSYALTAEEVPGMFVSAWKLDGETVQSGQTGADISADGRTLTLSSIYADHTVTAAYDSVTTFAVTWKLTDQTPDPIAAIGTEDLIVKADEAVLTNGAAVLSGKSVQFGVPAISEYYAVKWLVNGEEVPGGVMDYQLLHLTDDAELEVQVLDEAAIKYDITVAEGIEHGTVTPSTTQQRKNQTVSVTAEPAEHYHLKELTVKAGETALDLTKTENPDGFTFVMPQQDVVIDAVFEENPKATVTFQVEHGTWSDHTTAVRDVTVWLDLETLAGTLPASVVPNEMLPDTHFDNGHWVPALAQTVTEDVTYTYTFEPVVEEVDVTFRVVNGTWNDHTRADRIVKVTLTGGVGTLDATLVPSGMVADEGYENGRWDIVPNTNAEGITGETTYEFRFEEHIPVETTAFVVFRVSHGTWADGSDDAIVEEITLYDGIGTLPEKLIPTDMKPNRGYTGGRWDEEPNTEEGGLTGNEQYTYFFEKQALPEEDDEDEKDNRQDHISVRADDFTDVDPEDYFYQPVKWAVKEQITSGMDATHFGPDLVCTRAQAVTFLWREAGCPEPENRRNPFDDVKRGDYFYDAVLWAVEEGITKGTSASTFSPNLSCTRAQIVTFLWRAEGMPEAGRYNPFVDVTTNAYYADAVLWAVEEKITNGTSAATFSPDLACTRAQIVTFLYRNR